MHGLINTSIQSFVTQTYGAALWGDACRQAGLDLDGFEAMLVYPPDLTLALLDALCALLNRDRDEVLEDLGTFLVTHPAIPGIRRLLRFCGTTFEDFLMSLDDLPDRVRLAVSDLCLPGLELVWVAPGECELICQPGLPGYHNVLTGVLRAMADDYGALVILETGRQAEGAQVISIRLIASRFTAGNLFTLSRAAS
ncbi:MAG: heme NO-binding protein [Rhodobacteraceae bacterium]|nr:MAG: heme NO-binding protein [Paracoccaceae bacterium]